MAEAVGDSYGDAHTQSLSSSGVPSGLDPKIHNLVSQVMGAELGLSGVSQKSGQRYEGVFDTSPEGRPAIPRPGDQNYFGDFKDMESVIYYLMDVKLKIADDSIEGAQGEIEASMDRRVQSRKIRQEKLEEKIDEMREAQEASEKAGGIASAFGWVNGIMGAVAGIAGALAVVGIVASVVAGPAFLLVAAAFLVVAAAAGIVMAGGKIAIAANEMEAAGHEKAAAEKQAEADNIKFKLLDQYGKDEESWQKFMKAMFKARNEILKVLMDNLKDIDQSKKILINNFKEGI